MFLHFIHYFTLLFSLMHPVHFSVTTVDYKAEEKKFEISFKLFADDLENIISQKYGIELNLNKEFNRKGTLLYVNSYINEHFDLLVSKRKKTCGELVFIKKH